MNQTPRSNETIAPGALAELRVTDEDIRLAENAYWVSSRGMSTAARMRAALEDFARRKRDDALASLLAAGEREAVAPGAFWAHEVTWDDGEVSTSLFHEYPQPLEPKKNIPTAWTAQRIYPLYAHQPAPAAADGFVMVPREPTDEAIKRALSRLGVKGYWREDAKPFGGFYSGCTAEESEEMNWRYYGKDRVLAAYAELAGLPQKPGIEAPPSLRTGEGDG